MKYLLCSIGALLFSTFCYSQSLICCQSVQYAHDARGNIITRTLYTCTCKKNDEENSDAEEAIDFAFKVYPVPARDHITVQINEKSKWREFKIYSSSGTLIEAFSFSAGQTSKRLPVTEFAAGTYFIIPSTEQFDAEFQSSFVVSR